MATLQKTTLNQNISSVSVFLILVSLVLSYLYLLPNRQKSLTDQAVAQAKDTGLNRDIASLQTAKEQLSRAESAMLTRGVSLESATRVLPANEDVPGLYVQMDSLVAMGSGLSLTKIKYTLGAPALETSSGMSQVPVTVTATGQYSNIKSFIVILENATRPLSFQQVSLAPVSATDATVPKGSYSVTMSGMAWGNTLSQAFSAASAATGLTK